MTCVPIIARRTISLYYSSLQWGERTETARVIRPCNQVGLENHRAGKKHFVRKWVFFVTLKTRAGCVRRETLNCVSRIRLVLHFRQVHNMQSTQLALAELCRLPAATKNNRANLVCLIRAKDPTLSAGRCCFESPAVPRLAWPRPSACREGVGSILQVASA